MEETNHAKTNARANLDSIIEMMNALKIARDNDDDEATEAAEHDILDDPLSVDIRKDWHSVGGDAEVEEFKILLSWGGPACQIIGDIGRGEQPENPRLQYQDWGTPWTDFETTEAEDEILQAYCEQFYFGE